MLKNGTFESSTTVGSGKEPGKPIFSDVRESRNKEKEIVKFLNNIGTIQEDGEGEYEVDDDEQEVKQDGHFCSGQSSKR